VLAGLAGALFTGTRGGMLALMLAAPLFLRYGDAMGGRHIRTLVLGSFILLGAAWLVPQTEVRDRVKQGVVDVTTYFEGGSAFTNVGIRLELWKGAALLIAEHPLMGVRHTVAKDKLAAHVKAGTLDPVVNEPVHFHNDILHVLVTGGVLGLLAWLSILAAPLVFFARMLRGARDGGKTRLALALAGMLVVLSYFAFGLTEVIFWSLRASLFYALMIFLLMGLCLNAKEADGK
jgi:O-antigen ligase